MTDQITSEPSVHFFHVEYPVSLINTSYYFKGKLDYECHSMLMLMCSSVTLANIGTLVKIQFPNFSSWIIPVMQCHAMQCQSRFLPDSFIYMARIFIFKLLIFITN